MDPVCEGDIDTTISLFSNPTSNPSSSTIRNKKKPRKHVEPIFIDNSTKSAKSKIQPGYLVSLDKSSDLFKMFTEAK